MESPDVGLQVCSKVILGLGDKDRLHCRLHAPQPCMIGLGCYGDINLPEEHQNNSVAGRKMLFNSSPETFLDLQLQTCLAESPEQAAVALLAVTEQLLNVNNMVLSPAHHYKGDPSVSNRFNMSMCTSAMENSPLGPVSRIGFESNVMLPVFLFSVVV